MPVKDFNIYQAEIGDLPEIMRVIEDVIIDMKSVQNDQWDSVYPNEHVIRQDINEHHLWLILVENCISGFFVLNENQDDEYQTIPWNYTAEPVLVVHRLCVHPASRRKGLARLMMDFAEQYAITQKYSSIRLDAYTGNPAALSLYENRGYQCRGQVNFPRRKFPFNCYEKKSTTLP